MHDLDMYRQGQIVDQLSFMLALSLFATLLFFRFIALLACMLPLYAASVSRATQAILRVGF